MGLSNTLAAMRMVFSDAPTASLYGQRITNSPLVRCLPFTIDGLGDETWRKWTVLELQTLLAHIAKRTNDHLSLLTGTAEQMNACYYLGHTSVAHTLTERLPPENSVFALLVLQLMAEKWGIPRSSKIYPPQVPTCNIKGRVLRILAALSKWSNLARKLEETQPHPNVVQNVKAMVTSMQSFAEGTYEPDDTIAHGVQFISVLCLLIPSLWGEYSIPQKTLIQVFQALGTKPPGLVAYEKALMDKLWKLAETTLTQLTVDRELSSFYIEAQALPAPLEAEAFFFARLAPAKVKIPDDWGQTQPHGFLGKPHPPDKPYQRPQEISRSCLPIKADAHAFRCPSSPSEWRLQAKNDPHELGIPSEQPEQLSFDDVGVNAYATVQGCIFEQYANLGAANNGPHELVMASEQPKEESAADGGVNPLEKWIFQQYTNLDTIYNDGE
ncbi:hypothetical protein DFH06DRAFT_1146167 [Mycena polygramma]|nr:hypothetical protein DFH06DRAFT_1146167 [Mycena polygramma]